MFNVPRPDGGGAGPTGEVGVYRRFTVKPADSTVFRLDLKPEYQITPTHAAFSVMVRAVADTGDKWGFMVKLVINTPTSQAGMQIQFTYSSTEGCTRLNPSGTKIYITSSGSTYARQLGTGSLEISHKCGGQQNIWYLIEGFIEKGNANNCFLRLDGKKFNTSCLTLNQTTITVPSGNYLNVYLDGLGDITSNVTLDFGHVYGTWSDAAIDDPINNLFEPLMDYDTAQAYYSDWPNWLINLNSEVNPYENIGNNPGIFTGDKEISIVNEKLTLNQIPDGYHRVLKLTTTNALFSIVADTQIINQDKPIFMVIIGTPMQTYASSATQKAWTLKTISVPSGPDVETGVLLNCQDIACNSSSLTLLNTQHAIKDKSLSIYKATINTALTRHNNSLTVVYTKVDNPGYINSNGDNYSSTTVGTTTAVVEMDDNSTCTQFMFKLEDYQTIQEPVQLRYLAVVTGEMIEAHPEIQWTDSTAMSNYFRVGGTTEIVANPRTAIPGVDQYVFYDAHQYRGSIASKSDYEFVSWAKSYVYVNTYPSENTPKITMVDNPGPYITSDV